MLAGTNLTYAHQYNQRIVLETIRRHGPVSRAEISRRTALTAQTASNIVDKLLQKRVVTAVGRRSGMRGQPAIEIALNPDGGQAIGLHLDRDHLTGVLLDLGGKVRHKVHAEWILPPPEEALPRLEEMARELVLKGGASRETLWGVGVGLPGPLEAHSGRLVAPPNLPGWDGIPFRDMLSERLGLPVCLDMDAVSAAVGERWFGAGRDIENYLYVYFSVGLGGGIVLNGTPFRGAHDTAGMFGHLPVEPDGPACTCGGAGCLELYASLASLYQTLGAAGIEARSPADAEALLVREEPVLLAWLVQAADRMARALVAVENLLNPQAIIFGGRLPSNMLGRLIEMLEERLPSLQTRGLVEHPRLLRAQMLEDAAALGAATLPLFDAFTPGPEVLAKASMK